MALHKVGDVVTTSAGIIAEIERIDTLYPGCSEHYYRMPNGDLRSTSGAFLYTGKWIGIVLEGTPDGMLERYASHDYSRKIRALAVREIERRLAASDDDDAFEEARFQRAYWAGR